MNNQPPLLHFKKWWLAIGWFLVFAIITSSLMPPSPSSESLFKLPYADKIIHCCAYFILMGWFAQIYHAPSIRWRLAIACLLLGVILEIIQALSGLRHGDIGDIIANGVGILLSGLLVTYTGFAGLLIKFEQYWTHKN